MTKDRSFVDIVIEAGVDMDKVHSMTLNITPGGTDRIYLDPFQENWVDGLTYPPIYNLKLHLFEPLTDDVIHSLCGSETSLFNSVEYTHSKTPLTDQILRDWRKTKTES